MDWLLTYRGPAGRFTDAQTGAVFLRGTGAVVDEDTRARIVDRTFRMCYRDSWDAEPYAPPPPDDEPVVAPRLPERQSAGAKPLANKTPAPEPLVSGPPLTLDEQE